MPTEVENLWSNFTAGLINQRCLSTPLDHDKKLRLRCGNDIAEILIVR